MSKKKGLADPSLLKPFKKNDDKIIRVVIETPKGSRNKYAFDTDARVFELKEVLPAGMSFPCDFGFLPSTLADDGDPTDVLVLMDEPAFPGCVLKCRIVGIIEGKQTGKGKSERNDRIIAVEQDNHSYASVKHVVDLGKEFARELEDFFVNYHRLIGKEYKILGPKGSKAAQRDCKR